MRVDDVLQYLTPEHFADGRVPSKSTLSDRLAGVGLQQDFVEAVADICSHDAVSRDRLLAQVQAVRERARAAGSHRPTGASSAEAQLVIVQQRSIEVSDKLVRAMERAAQLERERNGAHHMVLILLTMVEKLRRDIAALARERDRMPPSGRAEAELAQVHERLSRSERQRITAEAELERARAERLKADQLAEEAAEQVRLLTDELERLRGEAPHTAGADQPTTVAPALQEALDSEAGDIDLALSKAARHLDDSADRLDQLANELHLDNPPDNPLTSNDAPDNQQAHAAEDARLTTEEVLTKVRTLVEDAGDQDAAEDLLIRVGRAIPVAEVLRAAGVLRSSGLTYQAMRLIFHAAGNNPPTGIPVLVSGLRSQDRTAELYQLLSQVVRSWPASAIVEAVTHLRNEGQHSDAYQVLSAAGRDCPPAGVLEILTRVSERDAEWILDTACRDRPLDDLPPLEEILRAPRRSDSVKVAQAHSRRAATAAQEAALAHPRPRPASILTSTREEEKAVDWSHQYSVRPYALTGGDPRRPRHSLPLNAVVRTTADPSR
ncbi:hypothetical protein ACLIYP_18870 [Streptomyces nanhaiensis]|uniref:hypothetical protein n=1 Tax=Streptomyces nanhaiensis TaxID=679319 RepID=UPI00399D25C9